MWICDSSISAPWRDASRHLYARRYVFLSSLFFLFKVSLLILLRLLRAITQSDRVKVPPIPILIKQINERNLPIIINWPSLQSSIEERQKQKTKYIKKEQKSRRFLWSKILFLVPNEIIRTKSPNDNSQNNYSQNRFTEGFRVNSKIRLGLHSTSPESTVVVDSQGWIGPNHKAWPNDLLTTTIWKRILLGCYLSSLLNRLRSFARLDSTRHDRRNEKEGNGIEMKRIKARWVGVDRHARPMFYRCRYVSGFERPGICAYKGRTEVAKTTRWKDHRVGEVKLLGFTVT